MDTLIYNENSKQISFDDKDLKDDDMLQVNLNQINALSKSLIAESNPNFNPKPNDKTTQLVKNLFESGVAKMKQNKLNEALKNISLAIDMALKSRTPYEAFAIQLQELQFMLRHKIDLQLLLGKNLDALQDLDLLLGTGVSTPDVFIRKTDALLKLKQYNEAKICCERGLSLAPSETKLKAFILECNRKLAEYNGDL